MPPKSSSKQFSLKKLSKIKVYLLFLILVVSLFGLIYFIFNQFRLHKIQVEGNIYKTEIVGLNALENSNLLFLSLEEVKTVIGKNNPSLELEEIKKHYPGELILKITLHKPIAQIKLNTGYAQLSLKGKILKKTKEPDQRMPIINFYQKFDFSQLNPGEILDYKELLAALNFLNKTSVMELNVESIDISGLSMIVFNLNNQTGLPAGKQVKILFSADKDTEKQSYELETLLTQFKIKAQDFKILDLRFDKPVVTF